MILSKFLSKARKSHLFTFGLPFIGFIIGGSFVLKEFASVRYELSRHYKQFGITPELLKEIGFEVKNKTIEEEYDDMVNTTDTDNWKNIRGPRPWEEDSKEYKEMIEQRIAERSHK